MRCSYRPFGKKEIPRCPTVVGAIHASPLRVVAAGTLFSNKAGEKSQLIFRAAIGGRPYNVLVSREKFPRSSHREKSGGLIPQALA